MFNADLPHVSIVRSLYLSLRFGGKIIVLRGPGESVPGESQGAAGQFLGHHDGQVQLVPAPLYHANGFYVLQFGLFATPVGYSFDVIPHAL